MLAQYVLSVFVCPSVRSRYRTEPHGGGSSWLLAQSLPSTCPTLCDKEIRVSLKITALLSGTSSRTLV